ALVSSCSGLPDRSTGSIRRCRCAHVPATGGIMTLLDLARRLADSSWHPNVRRMDGALPAARGCRGSLAAVFALLLAAHAAQAQWSTDPQENNAIADRAGEQVVPKIAVTPAGDTYVAWFDHAAGSYDVYLQLLTPAGVEVFPHNGILVSDHAQSTSLVDWDLIADSQGNAVVTFTDTRDGGDLDVFAYRIAPDQTFLWGADGVQLSFESDYTPNPVVTEASDGDFVFVWAHFPT